MGKIKYEQKWTVILNNISVLDAGNYTCKVCNDNGCQEFTYIVNILGK